MTKKIYWDNATEQALIQFNRARSQTIRERIFEESLLQPLTQMVEVYVARYLPATEREFYINDCLSFLMTVLHKYKPKKGKSFGYISIVLRNYVWKTSRIIADRNNRIISGDTCIDNSSGEDNKPTLFDMMAFIPEELEYLERDKFEMIAKMMLDYWTKERIRDLLMTKYKFKTSDSFNSAITIRKVLERHFLPNNPEKLPNAHMPTYRTMEIIRYLVKDSKRILEEKGLDFCN